MLEIPDAPPPPDPGIPSLGGLQIASVLRALAAATPSNLAIVETGAWLGAGTWQMADAVRGRSRRPPMHVFDKFQANKTEADRAVEAGLHVVEGQDTRPLVHFLLSDLGVPIKFHKCNLRNVGWQGGKIGLFVDDAAKQKAIFANLMREFGPSFVPGRTILVLMDYNYWRKNEDHPNYTDYRAQADFMEAHTDHFEHVGDPDPRKSSTAVFRYRKALDFEEAVEKWVDIDPPNGGEAPDPPKATAKRRASRRKKKA